MPIIEMKKVYRKDGIFHEFWEVDSDDIIDYNLIRIVSSEKIKSELELLQEKYNDLELRLKKLEER